MIRVLKGAGKKGWTVPTTGQDATLQGMEWILDGYQCGAVYKPIYMEAQAAVALATYLRAGQTPPAGLVNGRTADPKNAAVSEPAVLLIPIWVNSKNMESTVIADKFVDAGMLCAGRADACAKLGIH